MIFVEFHSIDERKLQVDVNLSIKQVPHRSEPIGACHPLNIRTFNLAMPSVP